jgi:IclR family transcriptional regulator, KDG regulon repressor
MMHIMQQPKETHKSIKKALMILSAFEHQNREMGIIDLSQQLGFHKSMVSRMVKVLTASQFLQQNPRTGKYSLGPAISRLSRSLNQSLKSNLVYIAKPYLDMLRDELKETIVLEVLSGRSMVMAYVAEGPRMVRLAGNIGDRVPFHAAAGAKAFLAFSKKEDRDLLLETPLQSFTSNTITDIDRLYAHFEEIRRLGFAFDQEELDEGTRAVGAPVLDHEKKAVAAVVVAGPAQAITGNQNSRVVLALKETAATLSAQLCYESGDPERPSGKS